MPRDDTSIAIEGVDFLGWGEVELRFAVDAFSTITMSAPFEAERVEFRNTFRPFKFKPIDVSLDGDRLFTGTMVDIVPEVSADERKVGVSGYAIPGVLGDCPAPASAVPLEYKKVGLTAIVEKLCGLFGLEYQFDEDEGAKFDKTELEVDKKILPFLIELAQQRGLVINDTPEGKLRLWRSITTGRPMARLIEGQSPAMKVTPSFSPQEYFSEITGFAPANARKKRSGAKFTARNKFLPGVVRPHSFKLDDTDIGDASTATNAKMGRMFAAMASYVIEGIPSWRDPQGELWRPNTTITLLAPNAMCYRETEMLVRAVNLRRDSESKSASLELVLPGAFSGEQPEQLPWEDGPVFASGSLSIEDEVLGAL